MKRLAAFFRKRWVVSLIGLAALAVLIWFAGPLFAFAGHAPLVGRLDLACDLGQRQAGEPRAQELRHLRRADDRDRVLPANPEVENDNTEGQQCAQHGDLVAARVAECR